MGKKKESNPAEEPQTPLLEQEGMGAGVQSQDSTSSSGEESKDQSIPDESTIDPSDTTLTETRKSQTEEDPTPEPQPNTPQKRPRMREQRSIPVCTHCFCKMKVSNTKGSVRYYKCPGCPNTDKTCENGLALEKPVFCIRATCEKNKTAMKYEPVLTRDLGTGELVFVCESCGDTQEIPSRAVFQIEQQIRDAESDVISR